MLKKRHRGVTAKKISELFKEDHQTISDRFFHINWILQHGNKTTFAVVTPKKLGLNAVGRNRLRRRAYAVVRRNFSAWTLGVTIAIVVKKAAVDGTATEFTSHLQKLLISITP